MTYQFIGAFPINIISTPISYDASSILKCTVSFSYMRYIRTRNRVSLASSPQNTNSPGNPELKPKLEQFGPAFGSDFDVAQNFPGIFSSGIGEGEELFNARTRRLTNYAGEPLF
jgi:hypothetical protein